MLTSNPSQKSQIEYQPLPKNAYEAARNSIIGIGFSDNAILDDYSFSTQAGQPVKINALAFAHPERRTPITDYAGFTIYNATNGSSDQEIVQVLAYLAAPFHLIHRQDRFSFWASGIRDNHVKPIAVQSNIRYGQLHNVLSEYAVDLKPQRIIDVKRGRTQFTHPAFADIVQPLQLSLWSLNVNSHLLVSHFGQAVNTLRESIREEAITVELATQLLGAIVLADTGGLGENVRQTENRLELSDLIGLAHHHFPQYFGELLFSDYFPVAEQAYTILGQIRYSGFAPEMLSAIYTAAYGEEQRKKLGRYDTPLYLTHRIWENIPVEFLPPEQRVTVDMTCGWGSFLLAGYERLSELKDMRGFSLRDHIHGNDSDHLTARLASLGLLISASKDSWHVDAEDVLTWGWLNKNQPNIIVGNPPFGGARKGEYKRTSPHGKGRYEEANKFLERAIEVLAPNGFLAMLMPQSFVAAEASPELRKQLLEACDVLELWELPIGVFPEATAGTLVIFAQKKDNHQRIYQTPVRVRTVQKQTAEKFKETGIFTASSIAIDQSKWDERSRKSRTSKNTHIIDYTLTLPAFAWANLHSNCINLSELVIAFPGATVGNPEKGGWVNYPFPKRVSWLTNAKNIIKRSFFIDYDQQTTIVYPNELERPRKNSKNPEKDKEQYLANKKVLLTATHNPSWGKRIKVAIERKSCYVSNSFWVIVPKPKALKMNITHEVLAAVLNWYVSNAWVIEHLKYPWIQSRALQTLPFPRELSQKDCEILTEAVLKLEAAAIANKPEAPDALQTIDSILKSAYQLDDETYHRLTMIYEWDDNPQITLDQQPDPNARWEISGIVEDVNASEGTITLWLNGFDHFETVPLSPVMPGWLLRPEVAFRTAIPRECVRKRSLVGVSWGKFYPQEHTYLSEEELFEQLTHAFYPET